MTYGGNMKLKLKKTAVNHNVNRIDMLEHNLTNILREQISELPAPNKPTLLDGLQEIWPPLLFAATIFIEKDLSKPVLIGIIVISSCWFGFAISKIRSLSIQYKKDILRFQDKNQLITKIINDCYSINDDAKENPNLNKTTTPVKLNVSDVLSSVSKEENQNNHYLT